MTNTATERHWQGVYGSKKSTEVSWYQPAPERSLQLIRNTGISLDTPIIDVGGGASTLVDHLLEAGYRDVTVLDIADAAFAQSRQRLGHKADDVNWVVADVREFDAARTFGLWHDRALLHFQTEEEDRRRYVEAMNNALAPGGYLVLSTFGPNGPLKCSGLDVRRYDIAMVADLVGDSYELYSEHLETHTTPGGSAQQFLYSCWIRRE